MKKHLIWILIGVSFVLYFRMLFNGFVGDDFGYINHPYIKNFEVLNFFRSGSADLGGASLITGSFFRPLMLVVISFIYQLSGSSSFLYHLIQLLIHTTNGILLFVVLKKFFKENLAFFLAFVFLIHPVNVETVSYISNLQDVLYVFFGLCALLALMNVFLKKYNLLFVNFCLLFSLLSKETGILFVAICILWVYLFKKSHLKNFYTSFCIFLTTYLFIRCIIAGVWIGGGVHTVFGNLSLGERLVNSPAIIFHYLYIFVFPKDLLLAQTWITTRDFNGLYLPVITIVLAVISLVTFLKRLRNSKTLFFPVIFFSAWLSLGLLLHSQIFPLEMTVADRWFYFPLIGLLGIVGVIVESNKTKLLGKILMVGAVIVVVAFFIRSYIRIGDFKDSLTLYSHDTKHTRSYLLEHSLGYELIQVKEYKEALPHLLNSVTLFENTNNTNTLGVYYYQTHATTSAISMFEKSITLGDNYLAYRNASQIYIDVGNFVKAEHVLKKATSAFPKDSNFWFLLSIAEYKLGKNDKALDAAEIAYQLNPTSQNFYIVNQLRIGEPIKFND